MLVVFWTRTQVLCFRGAGGEVWGERVLHKAENMINDLVVIQHVIETKP